MRVIATLGLSVALAGCESLFLPSGTAFETSVGNDLGGFTLRVVDSSGHVVGLRSERFDPPPGSMDAEVRAT